MSSKYTFFIFFIIYLLLGCGYKVSKSYNEKCLKKDTINIECYYTDYSFYLSGKRIYPEPCLNDTEALYIAEKTQIFSVIERLNTFYVLSGKNIFNIDSNNYLPIINDIILNTSYSTLYNIDKDPDPPKWTSLENRKDTLMMELKSQGYDNDRFIFGTITDTIFRFKDGIRVGIDKATFFQILGVALPFNRSNFTVVLLSMFDSNVSWYYKYYCSKYTNKIYCSKDKFHVKSYLKYCLTFKNNKIVTIKFFN